MIKLNNENVFKNIFCRSSLSVSSSSSSASNFVLRCTIFKMLWFNLLLVYVNLELSSFKPILAFNSILQNHIHFLNRFFHFFHHLIHHCYYHHYFQLVHLYDNHYSHHLYLHLDQNFYPKNFRQKNNRFLKFSKILINLIIGWHHYII